VQTGVVDGSSAPREGYYSSFRDVTKFYIPINTHFEVWYLIMARISTRNWMPIRRNSWRNRQSLRAAPLGGRAGDQTANEKKLADVGAKIVAVSRKRSPTPPEGAHRRLAEDPG